MATPDLTAGEVMDKAASLLNDTAKQVNTYAIQIPYLQMALQDLRKKLELNNSPITDETSVVITIPAGTIVLRFSPVDPHLPDDLVEIQKMWESPTGQDRWIPLTRKEYLPHYNEGITVSSFGYFSWMSNEVRLPEANADIDLKIDYIRTLFTDVVDENSELSIINADSYLQFRTAALLAEYVGENPTRALGLNIQANDAFTTLIGIDNKGKQAIFTRRRPFRSSWKRTRTR